MIHQIPKIIAIQAKNCAPLVKAYQNAKESASPVTNTGTLAEGIAIAAQARSKQILEAVQNTNGTFIDIEEEEILNARSKLSEKGFYVEVTSAVNFAGYMKYKRNQKRQSSYLFVVQELNQNNPNLKSEECFMGLDFTHCEAHWSYSDFHSF